MIKKRLLEIVPESKKYIASNVLFQWLNMWCNIIMVYTIAYLLTDLLNGIQINYVKSLSIIVITIILRIFFIKLASSASYKASKSVKKTLRGLIYKNPHLQRGHEKYLLISVFLQNIPIFHSSWRI